MQQRVSKREAQQVRNYLKSVGLGEVIELQKLAIHNIGGVRLHAWDAWTDDGRFYVISPAWNHYPQDDFGTLETAEVFHIGLMQVELAKRPGPSSKYAPNVVRKMDQAWDRYETAEEPEDFQAVAMRLREALVVFMRGIRKDIELQADLQDANFLGWAAVFIETVACGSSIKELRVHLSELARTTWQMVQWLTHAQNATRRQTFVAIDATDHLLVAFVAAKADHQVGPPQRCPNCGSTQLKTFYEPFGLEVTECLVCEVEVKRHFVPVVDVDALLSDVPVEESRG